MIAPRIPVLWSAPMSPRQKVFLALSLAAGFAALVSAVRPGEAAEAAPPANAAYRNAKLPVDKRVADLLKRMTLAEKVAQLGSVNWQQNAIDDPKTHELSPTLAQKLMPAGIGEITRPSDRHDAKAAVAFANAIQKYLVEKTRLGIPALMHEEALHGFQAPAATSFPQAIGLSATFDPDLVEQVFTVAARQARARGVSHVLAPVIDVARDPRWGRIEETFGEDPYLVTRMGVAAIHGFQGRGAASAPIDGQHVAATAKHFTGHGTPEGGRNTAPGNYSMHVLREVFLPPFEAAVREANVATVMASYNEVDGIPSHANHWLLTELLRGEWKFPGLVVSDYFGIIELERKHHVVATADEAGRVALAAGVDLEVPQIEGFATLKADVDTGKVKMALVDQAAARVLRAKFLLGLFEHPYVDANLEAERPTDRALARKAADETIVLLKNDRDMLPLDPAQLKSIAVIGPNAAVTRLGGYSGTPDKPVSVVDGLRARLGGKVNVTTAPGCGLTKGNRGWADDLVEMADPAEDARLTAEAAKVAKAADVVLLVLGQNEQLSREGWADNHQGDRTSLDLPGRQMDLARAVLAAGKPTILLLLHGSPLTIPELTQKVPAILDGFYLGEETGSAVADVLLGDVSPAGRLPVSVPRSVGTIPAYYDYKPSARRLYLFEQAGPAWPFGYGLSYTTFKYDAPTVSPASIAPNGKTTASVTVTNTGKRASDEVVQLYVHDVVSSVTRPVQELKGFRRIHLAPGESKKVDFPIGFDELSFYDAKMKKIVEPGRFEIMVGGSSDKVQKANLDVTAK
jgi:beta-glucosidase